MSDRLIIPGQPSEPAGPEQLIVPGGGARPPEPVPLSSDTPPADVPASETGGQPTEDTADDRGAAAGLEQVQQFLKSLRYPPSQVQLDCPQCSAGVTSLVFPIQDYGANPALLTMFLSGQLNTAQCGSCGNQLMTQFPVMVHWPEQEFLGVVVPEQAGAASAPQAVIGSLQSTFLTRVPVGERKGYMLAPRQFMALDRLHDALWEFQGVTREMREHRAAAMSLLQRMLGVADDTSALAELAQSEPTLIDREFLLLAMQLGSQEAPEQHAGSPLQQVIAWLSTNTQAGLEIKQQQDTLQDILQQLQAGMDKEGLATRLIQLWTAGDGQDVVLALVQAVPQQFDYEFLLELSTLIELETDDRVKDSLGRMREQIDDQIKLIQQQVATLQQNAYQACVAIVSAALQSQDPAEVLRRQSRMLRGPFFNVLMNMMAQAQKNQAPQVVNRLLEIRDIALNIQAESMSEEDRFLFTLISARTVGEMRAAMERHGDLNSDSLLEKLDTMAKELGENDMEVQARKIRSLRNELVLRR
ncbi:MAG: hypothetical protein J4G06_00450 [Caldilineaceae bacterium]|nr:hypothetical protein [Caldilineaceae bacterium]